MKEQYAYVQPRPFNGQEKSYLAARKIKWTYGTEFGLYRHNPVNGVLVVYDTRPSRDLIELFQRKMGASFQHHSLQSYNVGEFTVPEGCIVLVPRPFNVDETAYLKDVKIPWNYFEDPALKRDLIADRRRPTPFADDADAVIVNIAVADLDDPHRVYLEKSMGATELPLRHYMRVSKCCS